MINFNFRLYWPYRVERKTKSYFCIEQRIPFLENKSFCLQADSWGNRFNIIGIEFSVNLCRDHGGFDLDFDLLGVSVNFNFYDHRHWNYEAGRYQTDEEVKVENAEWEATKKGLEGSTRG